jgi:hypothetical protein
MVQLEAPRWCSPKPCPTCGQGEALVFCACPQCGHLVLECAEEGSVLADPRDLNGTASVSLYAGANCPRCREVLLPEFRLASAAELQAAGYRPGEYV